MRRILLGLSLLAVLFFGGALALSFLDSPLIERAARELVRIEVERRVGEKIDSLSGTRIAGLAQRALSNTEADIARTRQAIRGDVSHKVANVVADMLDADCECRKRLVDHAQRLESQRLSSLTQIQDRLVDLIESSYASVSRSLLLEFRIFSASNAVAFALLGLITCIRGKATLQLVLPAVVLIGAAVVTGGLYLLNQNWLHTIVFGQYVGMAYATYLSGVCLLLADIVFNRARATTRMVNLALQALGSVATAVPC
jgi:hypothetical protein